METQLVQKERLFEDKIKVGHPSNYQVIENGLHLRIALLQPPYVCWTIHCPRNNSDKGFYRHSKFTITKTIIYFFCNM